MARGTTPITRYPATIMTDAAIRNARQPEPSHPTRATVSRTVAAGDAVPCFPRLLGCHLRAEHDVAEQGRAWLRPVRALPVAAGSAEVRRDRGPQLVHGERQHVRGPGLAHPALMQVSHDLLIHEQH